MNIPHSITTVIFKNLPFSEAERQFIDNKFEKIVVKKGEHILKANQKVRHQYYVLNGCLRSYYLDEMAKEHTLQFAIQDWWASDFMAFFTEEKSLLHIDCIREAVVYKISRNEMEEIYARIPKVERFFRKKMEQSFVSFQKRILLNLSHSAKDRYVSFVKQYPNIEKEIKNYHIASFLGITTESLSRIRKEIAQN